MNLKARMVVNPMRATQRVYLWNKATPKRVRAKIRNSGLMSKINGIICPRIMIAFLKFVIII